VGLFGFSAGMLGPLPWKLAPVALVVLLGYSLCKRFTKGSHLVLGLALAGAPLGAWIAVTGRLETPAWSLALGVLTWTAGFDILYALQDEAFDRARGLHSIPAGFGVVPALWISRGLHLLALAAWACFNLQMRAHLLPWLAWAAVAAILVREQWVVRKGDLTRIDHAFFTLNSLVGPILFLGFLLEWLQGRLAV
jgi:4-hydroxybenzoate polyprenyltransferase